MEGAHASPKPIPYDSLWEAIMPVVLDPAMDIPAIVRASPAGSAFHLAPGVYRTGNIVPNDGQTFIGSDGVILNGSVLLHRWERDGATWRARIPARPLPRTGPMGPGADLGSYREDLFVDDRLYRRVASVGDVKAGSWFYDSRAGQAVISADPSNRRVEIGQEAFAIGGSAKNVAVRNLTVEKYATAPQIGAIHGHSGENWAISDVVVRWNHGSGMNIGAGFVVNGGRVYQNGQLGIGGGRADRAIISGVEVFGNNYAGYDVYWEAGGVKIAASRGVMLVGNYVHHNNGVGLWGDIDMIDTTYAKNVVVENTESGIMHEISYQALIESNLILRNGQASRNSLVPSQILIQNSQNVRVRCNYVEVAARVGSGITMTYETRGSGLLGPWDTKNNTIENNTIVHLDSGGMSGFSTTFNKVAAMSWPNTWENNEYIVPKASAVHWDFGGLQRSWKDVVGRFENGSRLVVQQRSATPAPPSLHSIPRDCP